MKSSTLTPFAGNCGSLEMREIPEIDTTELDSTIEALRLTVKRMLINQRIADLEHISEGMRLDYEQGERGPDDDPNEPDDYASKSHGY